jgi:hypothetical protein
MGAIPRARVATSIREMALSYQSEAAEDIRLWYGDAFDRWTTQLDGCVRIDSGRDCDKAITEFHDRLTPLGDLARASLVSVALEMGGRGSLARLIAFRGSPTGLDLLKEGPADHREMIARTANTDADAVMGEWLRRVRAARPDRAGENRESRLGSFLWIAVLMSLATRSTRWRLG